MRPERLALLLLCLVCCHRPAAKSEPETAAPHEGDKDKDKDKEEEGAPKHVKVRCAAILTQPVYDRIELHGTVVPLPDRDAQVAPQVAGRLLKVLVREGDAVKLGQIVAEVDPGSIGDQLNEAKALVEKAAAEEQNARVTKERVERVFQRGIAARQEVDDAAAREASARAAQAQAVAAARRAQRQLEFATVRSPLPGVVLRVLRRTGELVDGTPATAVVEVGDPSALELVADAAAQDLVQLERGSAATVAFTALPGRSYAGTVAAVAPAVDRTTGLGRVRVGLTTADPAHTVAPPVGLYGTASIAIGQPHSGLVAPSVALRSRSGLVAEIVVCGKDGAAHVRRVHLGSEQPSPQGPVTELRSTDGESGQIGAGEQVAVEPVLGISEGDQLEQTASAPAQNPPTPAARDGGGHD